MTDVLRTILKNSQRIADALFKSRNVWFVDVTNGDDNKDGSDIFNAKQNLEGVNGAISLLGQGDTLFILRGVYTLTDNIDFNVQGVNIIGISPSANLGGVKIDGDSNTITISANGQEMDGLYFINDTSPVVNFTAKYCELRDVYFYANNCAYALQLDDADYNIFRECIFRGSGANNTDLIYTENGSTDNQFIECTSTQARVNGLHINHANAVRNKVIRCSFGVGSSGTGVGIYIQAGTENHIVNNSVGGFTTPYSIITGNYLDGSGAEYGTSLSVNTLDISALIQITGTITVSEPGFYRVRVKLINGDTEANGLAGGSYDIRVRDTSTNADNELAFDNAVQLTASHSLDRISKVLYISASATIGVWVEGQAGDTDVDAEVHIYKAV